MGAQAKAGRARVVTTMVMPRCTKVLVTNIGPIVTKDDLVGMFSHCGEVADCRISSDVGGSSQRALIEFKSQHPAQTAMLLSGAPLADRDIRVEAVEPRVSLEDPGKDPVGKLSVMQRMLSAGFCLPDAIVERAREFDECENAPVQDTKQLIQAEDLTNETFDPTKAKPKVEVGAVDRDAQLNAWYKVNEPVCYEKEIAMAKATAHAEYKATLIDGRFKMDDKTVAPPDKGLSMAKA